MGEKTLDKLDSRGKGDIYWRKLKRFITAEEERGIVPDEEKAVATEVFHAISGDKKPETVSRITGNEFKPIPPTSAARELHKNGIINLYANRNVFAEGDETEKKLAGIIDKTLKVYFNAAGIDEDTGKDITKEEREAVRKVSEGVFLEYQKAVSHLRRDIALKYIASLGAEAGPAVPYEDEIEKILSENKPKAEDMELIDKAHAEYSAICKKDGEMTAKVLAVKACVSKDLKAKAHKGGMTAYEAYKQYIAYIYDEHRALAFAKESCVNLVKSLVRGKIVNPVYALYIKEHWGVDVPTIPVDAKIVTIEGYNPVEYADHTSKIPEYSTFDEFRKAGEELKKYRESHIRQFEGQTLYSVLFGIDELPEIQAYASVLRNRMAAFALSHDLKALSEAEHKEFRELWSMADAMARITGFIIDFSIDSEQKVMGDLLDEYADFVYEMDYRKQLRLSKDCFDAILERRGKAVVHG